MFQCETSETPAFTQAVFVFRLMFFSRLPNWTLAPASPQEDVRATYPKLWTDRALFHPLRVKARSLSAGEGFAVRHNKRCRIYTGLGRTTLQKTERVKLILTISILKLLQCCVETSVALMGFCFRLVVAGVGLSLRVSPRVSLVPRSNTGHRLQTDSHP